MELGWKVQRHLTLHNCLLGDRLQFNFSKCKKQLLEKQFVFISTLQKIVVIIGQTCL